MVYHREYTDFLKQLRQLGVVHIKESKNTAKLKELEELVAKRKNILNLFSQLKSRRTKDAPDVKMVKPTTIINGEEIFKEVEDLLAWELKLRGQVDSAERELQYWKVWGDYDLDQLTQLKENGYPINFYISPFNAYKEEWEEKYGAVIVNSQRGHHYFVTVGDTGNTLEAEHVKWPTHTLDEMSRRVEAMQAELDATSEKIVDFANNRIGELSGYADLIDKDYAFTNALLQAHDEADNTLKVVEGWVPSEDAIKMEEALASAPAYIERLEIKPEDRVPIKLRNNAFSRLFEMITKMYSLPNYGEIDVTVLFAPFYMLFFAMCFGDGGYGLLLFLGATIARLKMKEQAKRDIATMMQWLGGATAIVGSLMGTVFGMVMPWANDGSLLGSVREDYFLSQENLMYTAVVIGVVQIIFGKFVAAYKTTKQKGFKYAIATFAWGIVFLAGILGLALPSISESIPPIVSHILLGIAGFAFLVTLFYNMPGKNPLLNLGAGIWNTYNAASGLLGDSLSYIRLFAIGLTGGILGGVFNSLAISVSEGLPIGVNFLVMSLILLFGHGLNFALCMIGSFVHPLRLTFVEFYKNAEFEGGGRAYNPLQ